MFSRDAWTSEQNTWDESGSEKQSIDEMDITTIELRPFLRFFIVFVIGVAFFILPVPWEGTVTVPFDIFVTIIEQNASQYALGLAWVLILTAAALTTVAELHYREITPVSSHTVTTLRLSQWRTSRVFWITRLVGTVLATGFFFGVGPAWLRDPAVSGVVWNTLILSVVIIIPLGSIFVNLLMECGALEFIGTAFRPVMKPFFQLPGRAALDSAASWAGSFAIGFYITRRLFDRGGYNKREVFIICSCFGTGSIGTIGVFAAAMDLLPLFPIILLAYLISIVATAMITIRIPPLSTIPEEYIAEPDPELDLKGTPVDYLRLSISEAMKESRGTSSIKAAWKGFIDGLVLTATFLGTVVTIGVLVLIAYNNTAIFQLISMPLEPVISAVGIPNADAVSSALVIGFADMYVGALTAVGLQPAAEFFVILVIGGQILFLSASGPMMMDMFNDIPVRFRDVVAIFVVRTLVLIPIGAALTHLVMMFGLFGIV
jgi:nucleoside recognition membrane protein YjiH